MMRRLLAGLLAMATVGVAVPASANHPITPDNEGGTKYTWVSTFGWTKCRVTLEAPYPDLHPDDGFDGGVWSDENWAVCATTNPDTNNAVKNEKKWGYRTWVKIQAKPQSSTFYKTCDDIDYLRYGRGRMPKNIDYGLHVSRGASRAETEWSWRVAARTYRLPAGKSKWEPVGTWKYVTRIFHWQPTIPCL